MEKIRNYGDKFFHEYGTTFFLFLDHFLSEMDFETSIVFRDSVHRESSRRRYARVLEYGRVKYGPIKGHFDTVSWALAAHCSEERGTIGTAKVGPFVPRQLTRRGTSEGNSKLPRGLFRARSLDRKIDLEGGQSLVDSSSWPNKFMSRHWQLYFPKR